MAQRKIDDSLTGAGKVLVMARQKKKNYDNLLGKSRQVSRKPLSTTRQRSQ